MARINSKEVMKNTKSAVQTNNETDDESYSIEVIKELYSSALERKVPISMQGYDFSLVFGYNTIVSDFGQRCYYGIHQKNIRKKDP